MLRRTTVSPSSAKPPSRRGVARETRRRGRLLGAGRRVRARRCLAETLDARTLCDVYLARAHPHPHPHPHSPRTQTQTQTQTHTHTHTHTRARTSRVYAGARRRPTRPSSAACRTPAPPPLRERTRAPRPRPRGTRRPPARPRPRRSRRPRRPLPCCPESRIPKSPTNETKRNQTTKRHT